MHPMLNIAVKAARRAGQIINRASLDLDLIVHGDTFVDTERLTLPHPRAAERSFVLEPWLEVDPDAVVPGAGRVADLLRDLPERAAATPPTGKPSP